MKTLLFTGGTGFLGQNIMPLLSEHYEVTTIGITDKDILKANLATEIPELTQQYDVVLHAAGKAHTYPKTANEIKAFYDVNYQGTVNLCKALEKIGVPKSFVFISTMDVYGTSEGECISEEHPLEPTSHYAKSKLQAEEFLIQWASKNDVILGILRPALITGPNPPGNLHSMIDGIKKGYYLTIAGGNTRKSLLMVYDIAYLTMKIEEKGGIYNVCDDRHPSYAELAKSISSQLGKREPISIPYWIAWCMGKVGDLFTFLPINSYRLGQLTKSTTYSNEKAKKLLDWQPLDVIDNFKIQ